MNKFSFLLLVVALLGLTPTAFAADISTATVNMSGNVPVVFSVTARGYPGDLDLGEKTTVVGRILGTLHFKHNAAIAALTMKSSTASGLPEKAGAVAFAFATGMFLSLPGCDAVDQTKLDPAAVVMDGTAKDIMNAAAAAVKEEDCDLKGSWTTATGLQAAGKYSMTLTVTMTSI